MSLALSSPTSLRPVNLPAPLCIETDADGEPITLLWRGQRQPVTAVADRWRIDDEWWRLPISRLYRRVLLADGSLLTVFHDLLADTWYSQRGEG